MTVPSGRPAGCLEPVRADGRWLREQRQARGWNVQLMGRHLREAARTAGDVLPNGEGLSTMIRRWEAGAGMSERYRLHFCRAFCVSPADFGRVRPPGSASQADTGCDRSGIAADLTETVLHLTIVSSPDLPDSTGKVAADILAPATINPAHGQDGFDDASGAAHWQLAVNDAGELVATLTDAGPVPPITVIAPDLPSLRKQITTVVLRGLL
jgi:hypothetical protein